MVKPSKRAKSRVTGPRSALARGGVAAAIWIGVSACGGSAAPPPTTGAPAADREYPGQCALLRVEQSTRESDLAADSVELVARYEPDAEGGLPFGLAFAVRRERADDLRAHLEQHPAVLCGPEADSAPDDAVYRVAMPAFEGQSGRYVAPAAPAGPGAPAAPAAPAGQGGGGPAAQP